MTTGATGQLGLALPVQGELSGTWGDTVNNGLTQYINIAIAGTLTLTGDGAVTLANTTGDASASNVTSTLTGAGTVTAQFAIVRVTGTLTTAKVVTGPSYSKTYTVVNAATGGIVTFKASGQTGVSVAVGETAFVYFNGTDYVKVVGTATAGAAGGSNTQVQFNSSGVLAGSANMTFNGTTLTVNDLTDSSLTAGRVTYAGTAGNLVDSANLTFNGTTLTANTLNLTNALGTAYGGTGLTSFTSGGVVYASGTGTLATGSALTFDGTNLSTTGRINTGAVIAGLFNTSTGAYLQWNYNGTASGYVGTANQVIGSGSTSDFAISSSASGNLIFGVNTTEVFRATSSSLYTASGINVGIGTSSPTGKLEITSAATTENTIKLTGSTTAASYLQMITTGGVFATGLDNSAGTAFGGAAYSSNFYTSGAYPMIFWTNGTQRMRLDSSGNLGLGVTPSAWWSGSKVLQISGTSLEGRSLLTQLWTNGYLDSTGGTERYIADGYSTKYRQDSGEHRWLTAASGTAGNPISFTQAMTLDASGNLGIGTTSPSVKLEVAGAGKFTAGNIQIAPSTATNNAVFIATNTGGTFFAGLDNSTGTSFGVGNYSSVLYNGANTPMVFFTNATERLRLDSSGNLGLGVTPSAWGTANSVKAFQIPSGSLWNFSTGYLHLGQNYYFNGTNRIYSNTAAATEYQQSLGAHQWFTAASGTAGDAISFTQAMTLDASGALLLGTTSATPANANGVIAFGGSDAGIIYLERQTGTDQLRFYTGGNRLGYVNTASSTLTIGTANYPLAFSTNDTERARIDSSGNLLVGSTAFTARIVAVSSGLVLYSRITGVTGDDFQIAQFAGDAGSDNHQFFAANTGGSGNAAATMYRLGKASTSRSINAAGTINASGADYAEYMTKSGDFTVAKGDVIGINAEGKLTNVFADAVSFVVKSSDPSYVGGDVWGTPKALGLDVPTEESTDEEKETFATALETARQLVDRIAFAGQVPVNVIGATSGQYIIPVNDNGSIKGQAVSNPTFEQYQSAVGKVIAIEADGRARIIVKVA
jgi:hypothetical protein